MRILIDGKDIYEISADEELIELRQDFFEALEEWKKADRDLKSDDPIVAEGALERRKGANARLGLIKRLIKAKTAQN